MKNKVFKNLALVMSLVLLSGSIPANAYNVDADGNSLESVEYQNTSDDSFENVTNIFAEIGSEYTVTIPKIIVLSGETKSAKYQVTANGDIAGYEVVSIKPDNFVTLHAVNKSAQQADITQEKTEWRVSELGTFSEGIISANNISAGYWSGSFNFNIKLDSGIITLELENGKVELSKIDDKNLIDEIIDTGYIHSEEQIDTFYEAKTVGNVEFPVTLTFDVDGDEGDKIGVYHYDGTNWEYITLATIVNGQITAKFNSLSPIMFINRTKETEQLVPGFYDEHNNLKVSFAQIEKNQNWQEGRLTQTLIDGNFADWFKIFARSWYAGYNLVLPNDLQSLGINVFAKEFMFNAVTIPNTIVTIPDKAFINSTAIQSVKLPYGLTSIGNGAFSGCTSLKEVNIPNTVTKIGDSAFYNTAITEINIPSGVTEIKRDSFRATRLESVVIPEGVTSIETFAFYGCTRLEKVVLPSTLEKFGQDVFAGCSKLKSVVYDGIEFTNKADFDAYIGNKVTYTGTIINGRPSFW